MPARSSSSGSWTFPEECKNPPTTKIEDCCSIYPQPDVEKMKLCWEKNVTRKGKFCSSSDCILNSLGYLKNGTFDADLAKAKIFAMSKDNAWTKEVS